jgi:uncharacterized RDD family membrane protein YckC
MDWQLLGMALEGVVFIAMPILLFVVLYIGHMDYTGFLEKCGFGRREVGLLLVGGLVGIILGPAGLYAIPLFVYESSLLAIDLGGAIIPIVISLYLIKTKKLNIPALFVVIFIVGVLTYMTTEFRPEMGIVSEFPYYLLPSFSAVAMTLMIFRDKITTAIPFAYSATTFGVLIGADIVRIPQVIVGLEEVRQELNLPFAAGSIGGAGGLDLVFLAGLLAIAPLFFLAPFTLRHSKARITPSISFKRNLDQLMESAQRYLDSGEYPNVHDACIQAVEMKIVDVGAKFRIRQSPYVILDLLQVHPYIRNDYWILLNSRNVPQSTARDAQRSIVTARHLIREMEKLERGLYATHLQRLVAFTIDVIIILVIMMVFFTIGAVGGLYDVSDILAPQNLIWIVAFVLWLWIAQAIYFTILEGWIGQTPGKKLLGIIVTTDEHTKCDFMDAFTRNVVRLLDTVLLLYGISLILMSLYPKNQRIGDMVAKTVVMKV